MITDINTSLMMLCRWLQIRLPFTLWSNLAKDLAWSSWGMTSKNAPDISCTTTKRKFAKILRNKKVIGFYWYQVGVFYKLAEHSPGVRCWLQNLKYHFRKPKINQLLIEKRQIKGNCLDILFLARILPKTWPKMGNFGDNLSARRSL